MGCDSVKFETLLVCLCRTVMKGDVLYCSILSGWSISYLNWSLVL